ncbi:hypothetical protein H3C65_03990 [Patescibacteria group bacterium]|nr:hypothetical protein [Patescibacteria group bacterium]
MNKKIHVAILYSEAKREFFSSEEHFKTEEEVFERARVIGKRLEKIGFRISLHPGNLETIVALGKRKLDVALNLVDSIGGKEERAAYIPALLDLVGVPYTGADSFGLTLNCDKALTKMILEKNGILVPKFWLFSNGEEVEGKDFVFPLIVKLNQAHGSVEISQDAVVESVDELRKRVDYLVGKYSQTVIAEEYIGGKEITVLVIESGKDNIVLAEERILFKRDKYPLYDYEAAWGEKEIYDVKKYPVDRRLREDVLKAFRVLKFRDYGRIEVIVDRKGRYFLIDPNANPSFGPYGTTSGPFGYLLHMNKISFEEVAERILFRAVSGKVGEVVRSAGSPMTGSRLSSG